MKNSFYLIIPAQQSNPTRLKQFEEKALQQWLNHFPVANLSLASRLLHDLIIDANTIEMDVQIRLDALEMLRPNVSMIEEYLRSKFIGTGYPKEDNEKKVFDVLIAIERQFTIGYWMVLKQLSQRQSSWFQGKTITLAIHRCIKGLSSVIASHFMMGNSVPDWVWIDLHSLYRLSTKLKKEAARVAESTEQHAKASSAEECYLQILLLSLADPTGLMQKEVGLVYRFIETIVTLLSLKNKPVSGQKNQCLVLTDEDSPPSFQLINKPNLDASALYIDFSRLSKAFEQKAKYINPIEARFSSMHVPGPQALPSAELLEYLEQRWSATSVQSAPIFSDRLNRYIAIGFEATHDLQSTLEGGASNCVEVLAQSASERLLSCEFEKSGAISVGSLLSFRKTDAPEHRRMLGIVNKIIVAKQYSISFGLQMLTQFSLAVTYYQLNGNDAEIQQKGLLYSLKEQNVEKSYLIVDTFLLKDDDILRMYMPHDNFPIILGNKKNIGLGYWQFECRRLAEKNRLEPEKKGYDFI
ncbi:MAG: hypothetical protein WC782_01865 [Methylococcaceae bacterium]